MKGGKGSGGSNNDCRISKNGTGEQRMNQGQIVDLQASHVFTYQAYPLPREGATPAELDAWCKGLSEYSSQGYSIQLTISGTPGNPGALILGKVTGLIQVSADISRVVLGVAPRLSGVGH